LTFCHAKAELAHKDSTVDAMNKPFIFSPFILLCCHHGRFQAKMQSNASLAL
jgi:hypothetical protein